MNTTRMARSGTQEETGKTKTVMEKHSNKGIGEDMETAANGVRRRVLVKSFASRGAKRLSQVGRVHNLTVRESL